MYTQIIFRGPNIPPIWTPNVISTLWTPHGYGQHLSTNSYYGPDPLRDCGESYLLSHKSSSEGGGGGGGGGSMKELWPLEEKEYKMVKPYLECHIVFPTIFTFVR